MQPKELSEERKWQIGFWANVHEHPEVDELFAHIAYQDQRIKELEHNTEFDEHEKDFWIARTKKAEGGKRHARRPTHNPA